MPTRETGFALCIENRGADDLEARKVYRVLPDKAAAATGYVRERCTVRSALSADTIRVPRSVLISSPVTVKPERSSAPAHW